MTIDKDKLDVCWASGPDVYIHYITDRYLEFVGGELSSETMGLLNVPQHTLLAYRYLLDEVSEGGFIQLIQNGYGQYVLSGPFPMMMKKEWGLVEFGKFLYKVKKEYHLNREELESDKSDEDFMASYKEHEKLNDYGDTFLDDWEEEVTPAIATYVRHHEEDFITLG